MIPSPQSSLPTRATAVMFALGVLVAATPATALADPDGDTATSSSTSDAAGGTDTETDSDAPRRKPSTQRDDRKAHVDGAVDADTDEPDTDAEPDDDIGEPPVSGSQTALDGTARTADDDAPKVRRVRSHTPSERKTDADEPAASDDPSVTPVTGPDTAPEPADQTATVAQEPPADTLQTALSTVQTPTTTTAVTTEPAVTRPVNAATIVSDVLTWIGFGPLAADLPVPAVPVSGMVEMLWLAVRQTQYTWNNQRPTATPTLSGQGDDGLVTGNLNAVDYDDALLTYTVSAPARFGTVTVDATGSFIYTPRPGVALTTDTFTISIDDVPGNRPHAHGLAGLLGQAGPTTATVTVNVTSAAINDTAVTRPGAVTVQMDTGGRISVIDGTFTGTQVFDKNDAATLFNSLGTVLGGQTDFATTDLITVQRVVRSSTGVTEEFYRLRQSVDGIAVVGSEVVLVTDGYGTVTGLFNYYDSRIDEIDTTPGNDVADGAAAAALATSALFNTIGVQPTQSSVAKFLDTNQVDTELVIFAVDREAGPSLAWRVQLRAEADPKNPGAELGGATYYIYANGDKAGDVLLGASTAQALAVSAGDLLGTSRTVNVESAKWFYFFNSTALVDTTRNITTYGTSYGFLFGLGGPQLPGNLIVRSPFFGWSASGISAHANMAAAYDYYAAVLGRDSFDDAGAPIRASVGYNPRSSLNQLLAGYTNAFWDAGAQQFAFGNRGQYEAALDIVGHEFTHGVVSYVVGDGGAVLEYGESGALNEAYADILGSLIEGKTGSGRWLIGEDVVGGAIRSMANPTAVGAGYKAHYANRYIGTDDDGGEHWNSTIFSHAAYRMMTDTDTATVSSDTWAKVFYQSLYRLGPGANFVNGRAAVLDSAAENGFTASQLQAIADAFDGVGIVGNSALANSEMLLLIAV